MDSSWGRHHSAGSVSGIPSSSFLSYSLDLKPMEGWPCSHLAWGSPRVQHSNKFITKQTNKQKISKVGFTNLPGITNAHGRKSSKLLLRGPGSLLLQLKGLRCLTLGSV